MPDKKKIPLSGSLNQLKDLVNKAGIQFKSVDKAPAVPSPRKSEAPPPPKLSEESDEDLFKAAMKTIERIGRTSCRMFNGSLYPGLQISDKGCYVGFRHPNADDLSNSVVSYSGIGGFK